MVGPEIYQDQTGAPVSIVCVDDRADGELMSAGEVQEFIEALREAARLAFGEVTR